MQKITTLYTILSIGFCLLITLSSVKAQDPHFSQFYASPLQLNPAMGGVYDGQFRAVANYRDQWSSVMGSNPFRTYSVSIDGKFFAFKEDFFSVGMTLLGDQAGMSGYQQMKGHLNLSYLKYLSGGRYSNAEQFLIAGGQIGMGQHAFSWDKLQFSRQFDGDGYDGSLTNGENMGTRSPVYLDAAAGVLWYAVFDDRLSAYAGGSYHHLTSPVVSFYEDGEEQLFSKIVIHAGGEVGITEQLSVLPNILFMSQGPSVQTNIGANWRYANGDWNEIALRAGLWARVTNNLGNSFGVDAMITSVALELERVMIGLSYDINTSTLSTASDGRGAFEISVIYTHNDKDRYDSSCPKF